MRRRRAFTLIELLVVIAIIAVLIGILLPSLGRARMAARTTACAGRLQQMGVALGMYFNEFDRYMPQKKGPLPEGGEAVIGALFGGKKGQLPFYGINTIGAEGRPLNRYLVSGSVPPDDSTEKVELEAFRSPMDKGSRNTGVPFPPFEQTDSMYNLIGSSYTLNDHALDSEQHATLVPLGGGRLPYVVQPTKTWAIATHTIYNYQQDGDREMKWWPGEQQFANILFFDQHVRAQVRVPRGVVNTTDDYTFLPN